MPLILTTPNASPIRTYKNKVKVVRLHEFLGPARGSLSTESDSMSLCGTVIRDTQTVSYTGSNPNKTIISNLEDADDTIRIDADDLIIGDFHYKAFIGMRAEGEVDPTVKNFGFDFLEVGNTASTVALYAAKSPGFTEYALIGITEAPKALTNPYYKIFDVSSFFSAGTFTEGYTHLTMKAVTGTGGSYEWLLDVMYLVPIGHTEWVGDYFWQTLWDNEFDPVYDVKTDTYDSDRDSSPLDWDGDENPQYSVMYTAPDGFCPSSSSTYADFQIGDQEKTIYNVFPLFADEPISEGRSVDITTFVGSHYIPSHTIDSDSFTRTTTENIQQYLGASDEDRVWLTEMDHPHQSSSGGAIYCNGSQLVFKNGKFDGSDSVFMPPFPGPTTIGDGTMVSLGATSVETGTGGGTQGHETLAGLQNCTLTVKVSTDFILVAGFDMFAGFSNANSIVGVTVEIPTQGAFGARTTGPLYGGLMWYPSWGPERADYTDDEMGREYLDGSTLITSGYTPNTWVWLKVEMNWYHLRGKAWLDGDSEPDWMWEGFIPSGNESGGDDNAFMHPYEDDPDFGEEVRARITRSPSLGVFYWRPIEDQIGQDMQFTANPPVRVTSTFWDDFLLEYDAHGDNPTDVSFKMDKHDDSINFGQVTFDHESQRCVISATARHNSVDEADEIYGLNGVSMTTWKEDGAPDTQAACIGYSIEKAIIGGPIDLDLRFRPWEVNDID